MATRADYRTRLKDKLVGLEDEGYGDFEFTDLELNTYLELAVTNLYPALYKRVKQSGLALTGYGTTGALGSVTVTQPDRVYMVEDAAEQVPIYEWSMRDTTILGLDTNILSTVNVYYTDAYVLPADDVTDAGIPGVWTPTVVLGALIEALESRHDTGVRGEPPPTGQHTELPLIDRLTGRYQAQVEKLAMSLPAVVL